MEKAIVFDIGGTNMRAGLFSRGNGLEALYRREQAPSFHAARIPLAQLQEMLVEKITGITEEWCDDGDNHVTHIGVSFPGPTTPDGTVLKAPTLWGDVRADYPLREILTRRLPSRQVVVINDITAAGWRYIDRYDGTFCIITVSSGVGCKVFWKRRVLLNPRGFGGEIGHHYCDDDYAAIPCDCGSHGHVASIASGRGIEKLCRFAALRDPRLFSASPLARLRAVTTCEIIEAVRMNDPFAVALLRESVRPIAAAISALYGFIGIEKYIVIGGFALALGEEYRSALVRELERRRLWGRNECEIDGMIVMGENDDHSGLIGMGNYIFHGEEPGLREVLS